MFRSGFRMAAILLVLGVSCSLWAAPVVTNLNDSGAGSLREAVATASNGDTITFQGGLIGTISLASPIAIGTSVTITGPGAALLAIARTGSTAGDAFDVASGVSVSLSSMTLSGGTLGTAITNAGTLNILACGFSSSTASGFQVGGAIQNSGTLTVTDSVFEGNSVYAGGAIGNASGATATILSSSFSANISSSGAGDAIYNQGTLLVENSTFSGNTDSASGSAIYVSSPGTLSVQNSTFSGNSGADVNNISGSVTLANSILTDGCTSCGTQGAANLIGSGANELGPLQYNGGITPTMMPLPGNADILGAGSNNGLNSDQRGYARANGASDLGAVQTNYLTVANLNDSGTGSLRDALMQANSDGSADVIFNSGVTGVITLSSALPSITAGHLNIEGPGANLLTLDGNNAFEVLDLANSSSQVNLSGLTIADGNSASYAGGLANSGLATVENCAFNFNIGSLGGAIYNDGSLILNNDTFLQNAGQGGGVDSTDLLIVTNSTFYGNRAYNVNGGGIENQGTGVLLNDTINGNEVLNGGIGGGIDNNGALLVKNSIVSGNENLQSNSADDCSGCSGSGFTGITNLIGGTADLASLAYNGTGATVETMIPLPGSSVIGAGTASLLTPDLTTDERGFSRLTNGQIDLGAVQTNYTGMSFTVEPSNTVLNTAITPAVQVVVQEKNTSTGQTDAVNGVPVTISLVGSGTLSGTLTQTSSGAATFSDLAINAVANGDVLVASTTGLANADSTPFDVTLDSSTVSFHPAPPATVTYGAAPITLAAAATSGGSSTGQTMTYFVVSGPGTISGNTLTISGAGSVVVEAQAAANSTYALSSQQATITVNPAPLTVTATDATRIYGLANNPVFTGTVSGAVNSDTFTVGGTTTATSTSPVGTYSITPTAQAGSGVLLSNYNVTYVNGTLTITPATLTVTGDQQTRPYGTPNPTFTASVTGQSNNDTFAVSYNTTATQSSPVGTYTVVPTVSGANLANYTVVTTNGSLQIVPENLFVVANNATRVFGTANPAFSATITGAVLGDTFTPTFATVATQSSDAGRYDIQPSVTANANYTVIPTVGILTVTQAVTNLSLSASGSQVASGGSLTLTATATTTSSGSPAGTVVFYADNVAIGASTLNSQGVATLTVTTLSGGSHVITASYPQTRDFTAATAQLGQSVIIGTPGFTMSSSTQSLIVFQKNVGTLTLTLTPTYGYTGTVSLGCTGLPPESSCQFGTKSVTFDGSGSPVQVSLLIAIGPTGLQQSPKTAAALRPLSPLHGWPLLPAAMVWLPGAAEAMEDEELSSKNECNRKWWSKTRWILPLFAIAVGLMMLTGCSGLSPIQQSNGITNGPTNLTITATGSGNVQQSISVLVHVVS